MPISKRDLKMMTDNELFNGMTLVPDEGDGLNEMIDELARRARVRLSPRRASTGTFHMCRRPF